MKIKNQTAVIECERNEIWTLAVAVKEHLEKRAEWYIIEKKSQKEFWEYAGVTAEYSILCSLYRAIGEDSVIIAFEMDIERMFAESSHHKGVS